MALTPYKVQATPAAFTEWTEFNIQGLYLYRYFGANANQAGIVEPAKIGIGATVVNNWSVWDSTASNANLIANAQGFHIQAGEWVSAFSLVFVDQRFRGSTLEVRGPVVDIGEWAIVGGTGQFAMATGVISKKLYYEDSSKRVVELTIRAYCPQFKGTKVQYPVSKVGPWGGSGGSAMDIKEAPKRLQSITVSTGIAVKSIAFSYVDDTTGQKRTAGPWGGSGGNPETIELTDSEVLTQVSGTIGNVDGVTVITSIKFVTNLKTYGPWGAWGDARDSSFTVPVQPGSGIVGFFARSGIYLDALGIYVRPM